MAEDSNANQPTAKPTPSKHTKKANYQLISQLILLVVVVSALAWSIWQNQQISHQNQQLRDEIAELKKAQQTKPKSETPATPQQPNQNPSTNPQNNQPTQPSQPNHKPQPPVDKPFKPSAAMIDNITAILNTLDTRPIEGYLAGEVKLFYTSNTPATTLTDKIRIAKSLEYFSDAKIPWDFRLTNERIARYKKKFNKLFGDGCLTGSSADAGHVVSFCFNKEGKIHSIFFCRDPRVFNN